MFGVGERLCVLGFPPYLSQASLELSSSRGVFGSLENKGKRREKREHQTLTKATKLYLQK